MSETSVPQFELRNAGVGPDPLSLDVIAETVDFAILLLLRDYHCPKCRTQVQNVAERRDRLFDEQTAYDDTRHDGQERGDEAPGVEPGHFVGDEPLQQGLGRTEH